MNVKGIQTKNSSFDLRPLKVHLLHKKKSFCKGLSKGLIVKNKN